MSLPPLPKEEEGARICGKSQELAVDLLILRYQLGALMVVLEGLCKDGIQARDPSRPALLRGCYFPGRAHFTLKGRLDFNGNSRFQWGRDQS